MSGRGSPLRAAGLLPLALVLLALAPGPVTPPLAFSLGVACGDMAADSVVLWTRADGPAALIPEIDTRADFATAHALPPAAARAESDSTARVVAAGLTPGSLYHYRFRGPTGEVSATGTCRTAYAPDQAAPVTFAFSGDAEWLWKPYPLLQALNREPLDFFVFLGDVIYEWTSADPNFLARPVAETLDEYRALYRDNRLPRAGAPDLAPLRETYARFGQYSVFDNHELGRSRADPAAPPYDMGGAVVGEGGTAFVNQTPGFRERLQAYAEYQPVRTRLVSGTGDPRMDGTGGYYYAQQWGPDAILVVVDARSYRDRELASPDDAQADNPNRTMLGRPQLAWLQDTLLAAQQAGITWKLVVVSSPIQELGRASEVGVNLDEAKSWAGGYRYERDTLLAFVDRQGIDNVVFLTTDYHYTQVNDLRYRAVPGDPSAPRLPARNAFEVLAGPIGAFPLSPRVGAALEGLSGRAADRQIVATLNGDAPSQNPGFRGLRQAGLDPVGLEADFPGLVRESVWGAETGTELEAVQFATYNTFTYAVLTVDGPLLTVRVEGVPAVSDSVLDEPEGLARYLAEEPRTLLSFQVRAQ